MKGSQLPVDYRIMTLTGSSGSGHETIQEWLSRGLLSDGRALLVVTIYSLQDWLKHAIVPADTYVEPFTGGSMSAGRIYILSLDGERTSPEMWRQASNGFSQLATIIERSKEDSIAVIIEDFWRVSEYLTENAAFENVVSRAHKHGLRIITSTHFLKDYSRLSAGRLVLKNCDAHLLLRTKPEEIENAQGILNFSEDCKEQFEKLSCSAHQIDALIVGPDHYKTLTCITDGLPYQGQISRFDVSARKIPFEPRKPRSDKGRARSSQKGM